MGKIGALSRLRSVFQRADGETGFSILKLAEDSLKAGLESAWKTGLLHNRNHQRTLLVGNIHRLKSHLRSLCATQGSVSPFAGLPLAISDVRTLYTCVVE